MEVSDSRASGYSPLLVDFYELTMAAGYFKHKKDARACFDLFIRDLPLRRSFFLACGLSDAVGFTQNLKFDEESVRYLDGLDIFQKDFLEYLREFKFTGDVWAMPEGTVFFPNEPVIRVVAPLIEAQLLESVLLNIINLQTTIATKAARVVLAAKGRKVFDFSLRRTHGSDAALKAARASYVAGFQATSNVLAGKTYGIPVVGTMAHSYVMAFSSELVSFEAYAEMFPKYTTLLVDTYDTLGGVRNAIVVARELEKKNFRLSGIRIDSGNLGALADEARKLLDKAGFSYVKIFASGNLDEYKIKNLLEGGAPIDSFGVGTKMGVSADVPYSDVIYKLSEITDISGEFSPTMKLSKGKVTYPGRKQVYRIRNKSGTFKKDVIALENEVIKDGDPLLVKIIEKGKLVYRLPRLTDIRAFAASQLSRLPLLQRQLIRIAPYRVEVSPPLKALAKKLSRQVRQRIS